MFKRLFTWAGVLGATFVTLLCIGILGSVATYYIGAPMAAVPFVRLISLFLAPFPTLTLYGAALLVTFAGARIALGFKFQSRSAAQWCAGAVSVSTVALLAFGLPFLWNRAAGLTPPTGAALPTVVAPKGGEIALIILGGDASYASCQALCFSLLLQEQVRAVKVVTTSTEPSPLAVLPGKRFMLTPETRRCLMGQTDYSIYNTAPERHDGFIKFEIVPNVYQSCVSSEAVTVNPVDQTTIVGWVASAQPVERRQAGYSSEVAVFRTVMPDANGKPSIREARYRSGWRYYEPLLLWPYAGNAAGGSYFAVSISGYYFREPGFPENWFSPQLWRLLRGSEELGKRTADWLDTVVARRETSQP